MNFPYFQTHSSVVETSVEPIITLVEKPTQSTVQPRKRRFVEGRQNITIECSLCEELITASFHQYQLHKRKHESTETTVFFILSRFCNFN